MCFLTRLCLLAALVVPLPAMAQNTLRVVPQADLRVLDPHMTAATVTRIYGAMIYDQLYAFDEDMIPHPQMVAAMTASADKTTYDFTLRDGLVFHNGQPVTAKDIVASIPRAAKQDPMMQLMVKRMSAIEALVRAVESGEVKVERLKQAQGRLDALARRFVHGPEDLLDTLGTAAHLALRSGLGAEFFAGKDPTERH